MAASPQKENGYTPIANELLEAMAMFRIPGECEQVLKVIIRKTYGYNKREDAIANSQFVEATGMKKGNVSRALSKLITNRVVIKSDNKKDDCNIFKINKDYHDWIQFGIKSDNKKKTKKKLSKVITRVIKSDNKSLSEVMDTKDNKTILKERDTPSHTAKQFFKGIGDLMEKQSSDEATKVRSFLQETASYHPGVTKEVIWGEIKKFYLYWTEKNATGTKERWQKETTFQVERRLLTWFGKIRDFKVASNYKPTGRGLVE